jgi:hypothetical protein
MSLSFHCVWNPSQYLKSDAVGAGARGGEAGAVGAAYERAEVEKPREDALCLGDEVGTAEVRREAGTARMARSMVT